MRRLAVLLAGGALWLLLAASAALADGGPHQLSINSGTSGLSGDCAACHRAHTAQAADLLKASMPGLCLTCHDGTGATTDVNNGKQYVPDGSGNPTGAVLGALRGGGFEFALIDTSAASRMTYNRSGGNRITFGATPTSGTVTLTWAAIPSLSFAGGTMTFAYNSTAAESQTAADTVFGTSTAYSGSTAAGNMSGLPAGNRNVIVTRASATDPIVNFAFHNAFRTVRVALPTVTNNTDTTATPSDTTTVSATAHVGVLATGQAVTSTHEGTGTVWGNGPQGQGNAGATGVALECTGCHNPHGNGQYRILNTKPGEDFGSQTGVADWTAPANAVEIKDVGSTATTKNYTVLPGLQASNVVSAGYTATQGDYFRRKYDPTGAANWTNFYLKVDEMNTGWNNVLPTNKAANGGVAPANTNGLMTAWCITCHTRYNGWAQNGTASLNAQTPLDATYMFKHGTTGTGCEQCHVSHGSNAAMTAQFSAGALFPDGSSEDSALLKVDNRGTCNLCHEPTGTVDPGVKTGVAPLLITPGP